jgi:hypothetical protein
MGFITSQDVVARLLRRHPFWFHGEPKVELKGEERTFGVLSFDFGDELVSYRIYIYNRDVILDAAWMAVKNFCQLSQEYYESRD